MNEARSIKQNSAVDSLPNFRNLGVILRLLLLINGAALLFALLRAGGWLDMLFEAMQIATLITPIMLGSLLLLWVGQPGLNRLNYWQGVLAVNALVSLMSLSIYYLGGELYRSDEEEPVFQMLRCLLLSVVMTLLALMYFRMRTQVLSHALNDARLQVLRARIRPHFLYNTINAVLGIMRSQPKKAETALEDMADLFRMAMADECDMVPLSKELRLCRQYVALEQLRMGERLAVEWQMQDVPEDAQIPVLLLQPLLENAVYHGVEPLIDGGCIHVRIRRQGGMFAIEVENPVRPGGGRHEGNKIALQNIRERLALLFDAEARYQVASGDDFYRVEIFLPYVKETK